MKKIKLSTISMKTTAMDFQGNLEKILNCIENEKCVSSDLILFPELCISGYACEDNFYSPYIWKKSMESLDKVKEKSENKIIVIGLPIFVSPFLYNCAAVLYNKRIIGIVPKMHLANTGVHYEKRWFRDGFSDKTEYYINGELIPFGNLFFNNEHFSFGIEICEDSWVSSKPSALHSHSGADIILSMGASHFAFNKQIIRRQLFRENSRSQNNILMYSNLNGNESGRIIFEGGTLILQNGEIIKEGKRLHFSDTEINSVVLDLDLTKQNKAKNYRESYLEITEKSYNINFNYKISPTLESISSIEDTIELDLFQDFNSAVTLGLFDYLLKSRASGFTLSLSGGADSSACAVLIFLMKKYAIRELGTDIFKKNNINDDELLITLYQETKNNSEETKKYAKLLTDNLRIKHYEIQIDSVVDWITENISEKLGINTNWKEHDLSLQNIQARARSPIVWFMANLKNHLLISTGNRSEASVGYTTMDGDSSGSICPIAGVSKEFVLNWLDYMRTYNEFKEYFSSLEFITQKKPTAELKPLTEFQEDEKDLMPYPILQKIEFEYVFNGRREEEIFSVLKDICREVSEEDLIKYINKFISYFKKSQWKRERLPPSFHLDEYGLDPKSSYRFPILS
jgi:NAD+ synthase (glutamine-hydrolysing)